MHGIHLPKLQGSIHDWKKCSLHHVVSLCYVVENWLNQS
jgi:hypothetical protein